MTRGMFRISLIVAVAALGAAVPVACSDDNTAASGTQGVGANSGAGANTTVSANGGTSSGGSTVSSASSMGGMPPLVEAPCQSHIYQCGDLLDNDMDGLVDSYDPDCLG